MSYAWSRAEVLEMFEAELKGQYGSTEALPGPEEVEDNLCAEVSDSFLQKLLLGDVLSVPVKNFLSRRIVRRARTEKGGLMVDMRRPDPDEAQALVDREGDGTVLEERKYVLTLSQVLRDHDAMAKFGLSKGFRAAVERMSYDWPHQAAEMARAGIAARGYCNAFVKVAGYARSSRRAEDMVRHLTHGIPKVNPHYVEIQNNQMILSYCDETNTIKWSVMGKVQIAQSLLYMFHLCVRRGPVAACLLLGMEIEVLDITVWDAVSDKVMSGSIIEYSSTDGIEPLDADEDPAAGLRPDQREYMMQLTDKVLPVEVGDLVTATCLQMTSKFALMCEHVMNNNAGKELTIDGEGFTALRPVAPDLWAVQAERPIQQAWRLREPNAGEKAAFVYCVAGGLEVAGPVNVVSTDGRSVATTAPEFMRKGMSGAALVALSDKSLLGVLRGASSSGGTMCTVFSPEHYSSLSDLQVVQTVSAVSDEEYGDNVVRRLEERGYRSAFRQVLSSIEPLFQAGAHVGNAVCSTVESVRGEQSYMVAPAPTGVEPYTMADDYVPPVDRADQGRCVFPAPAGHVSLPVERKARAGETVILLGRTAEGPYVTRSAKVQRLGIEGARFSISVVQEDNPLLGCVVLAWEDACVIGQVVAPEVRSGVLLGYACASIYKPPTPDRSGFLARSLSERFQDVVAPLLWNPLVLEKLFTHPEGKESVLEYASVGDAHAKSYAVRVFWKKKIPHRWWTQITSDTLSNRAWIRWYERLRLDELVRYAPGGVSPPARSKHGADMIEALIGMALLSEGAEVADRLCELLCVAVVPDSMVESVRMSMNPGAVALVQRSVPASPVEGPAVHRFSWHGLSGGQLQGFTSGPVSRARSTSPSESGASAKSRVGSPSGSPVLYRRGSSVRS